MGVLKFDIPFSHLQKSKNEKMPLGIVLFCNWLI